MARELAEMVKRLPKLDWSQRESVRADLRRQVRRLLARYGYPPDLSEDATQLVLKQAELSTANGEQEKEHMEKAYVSGVHGLLPK
jgi:type I restriction enzyme, R subunit